MNCQSKGVAMDISELENWFKDRYNGDWEHQAGISIESTDNPGWYIKVDFDDLEFPNATEVEKYSVRRTERDFVTVKYDEDKKSLCIACGVTNLSEALVLLTKE